MQSAPPPPPSRVHLRLVVTALVRTLLAATLLWATAAQADEALWQRLKQGGQVVLIRHALTEPGVGDPPGFVLADCGKQRNLSEAGRAEARRLGAAFRARAIPVARVLTSPWCRCIDTAKIAFGAAQPHPALGNLFELPHNRERQMAGFRELIAKAPKAGNLILVTHGSTTMAFTGVSPATAEMVVLSPGVGGQFKLAGRIALTDANPNPDETPRALK